MADEIGHRGAAHLGDSFGPAQDRPADRLVGKGGFLEVIENNIVGGVGGLADFLSHRPFARQFGSSKTEFRMSAKRSMASGVSSLRTLA